MPRDSLLTLAEAYYSSNNSLVDEVVAAVRNAGLDETALDELVTEGAEIGSFDEDDASDVNNQGILYQVASILEGWGVDEGRRLIAAAVDEARALKR